MQRFEVPDNLCLSLSFAFHVQEVSCVLLHLQNASAA
jgi:hypothetical protein